MKLPITKTRADWSAELPKQARLAPETYTHLEVHHTASPTMASVASTPMSSVVRSIQRVHMVNNGWNDVFYHGIVGPGGEVWEGRPDTPNGAFRLCFVGNFEHEVPTAAQQATLAHWMTLFDGDTDWHARRAAGTKYASACPGRLMIDLIAKLASKPPEPPSTPGVIMAGAVSVDVDKFLEALYKEHFDREPDDNGRRFWTLELATGRKTPAEVETDMKYQASQT